MNPKPRAGEAVPKAPFTDLLARYLAAEKAYNEVPIEDEPEVERLRAEHSAMIDEVMQSEIVAADLGEAIADVRQADEEEDGQSLTAAFLRAALGYFNTASSVADPVRASKVASAMFDLEFDVLALMHMAELTANKFDQAAAVVGGNGVCLTFKITEHEHDQFTFLLNDTAMRADRLLKRYRAAQKGEVVS